MKQRVLVMNGQRIVQDNQTGEWSNKKVDKAGALKPGIYNIYTAKEADKSQRHEGVIVHVDNNKIYQQVEKKFVMHTKSNFDIIPDVGSSKSISYDAKGKGLIAQPLKISKGRSR